MGFRATVCVVWLLGGCMSGDDVAQNEASGKAPGIGDGELGGTGTDNSGRGTLTGPGAPPPPSAMAAGGSSEGAGDFGSAPADSDSSGAPASSGSAGAGGGGATPPLLPTDPSPTTTPARPAQSGVLTAGTWDDNLNFERFSEFRENLIEQSMPGLLPTTTREHATAFELWSGDREARQTLDIALVIDTTGSMGDELSYLQAELLSISRTIESQHPDAEQRWSLVVYKDEGDEYVVRWFDFRDDAADFRDKLAEQSAGGGGDFPEAPDQAFETMTQLAWRQGDGTARLAFWIADAPPHEATLENMAEALRDAGEQDIHVYPVASSGIDEPTELGMRAAAQLTGGRYIFLTDDSGIGGAHLEPSIPCYFVKRLDHAIIRMVDIELSGEYQEPSGDQVIRTGGDPQDRACTLASGDEVLAF
jgi:Mg-chelatase subunit ChlD